MGSRIPLPASFTSPMGNIARMHAVNKWLAQGAQLIALMIFGAYLFFWLREKPVHWRTSMYHAGLWARRHTPPDAVFGMTDAGIFGYYSERRVINLDGIVNNRKYQDYLHRRQLKDYLHRKGVQYLVVYVVPDSPRFPTPSQQGDRLADVYRGHYREFRFSYYARMYGDTPSDEIRLPSKNEVYRERHLKGMLIVWKLNPH